VVAGFVFCHCISSVQLEERKPCKFVIFLTGITENQCHHSQVRISPWATIIKRGPTHGRTSPCFAARGCG
jgi:hypothetical protein